MCPLDTPKSYMAVSGEVSITSREVERAAASATLDVRWSESYGDITAAV